MSKIELFVKTPEKDVDNIYKINSYASNFDDDGILNKYNNTPIGVSKHNSADIDNEKPAINPTELHAYSYIEDIKNIRNGFDINRPTTVPTYGLDEIYLISTALKNNIGSRFTRYSTAEYFNTTLKDWKKSFEIIPDSTSNKNLDISKYKSHIYVCEYKTNIYCTIRGVEFKYTGHPDHILDLYFYILPPDIFQYTDVYESIDSVRIDHTSFRTDSGDTIYPKVSYFKWEYDTNDKKWSSEDITTELTNQINNMNLIK